MDNDFYVNKVIMCKDCNNEFEWLGSDQKFLHDCVENKTPHPITGKIIEKVIAPVRCKDCRSNRKQYFDKNKSSENIDGIIKFY